MKLFTKLRKHYFTAIMSLALIVMASFGLFNLCTPQSVEASMIKFDEAKTVTITNGSFTSFSSSSTYPYTLSSFTTSGNSTPEMKTGAINISESEYKKNYSKYGLPELGNPKGVGTDNYVLMINADKDSDYTYTSSEFTLAANGHYYITVSAKTIGDNTIASVFLTQNDVVFENCIIENISSNSWSNYTFFVSTNAHESVKLKFGMQIGSKSSKASGCVLFDELHAGQISVDRLETCLATFPANSFKSASFRTQNAYKTYDFNSKIVEYTRNSKGEIALDGNKKPITLVENRNYFKDVTIGAGQPIPDTSNNQISASITNSYVVYKGEEETLQPNNIYRFSIWAKVSNVSSGSAFVKLDEIIDENDDYDDFMESTAQDMTPKSSKLSISSVTSNAMTSGYTEYVIYVNTGSTDTSKVQFSFGIGSETEGATATASFKDYAIERVPYSAYSSASTGSEVGKIDISERLTLSSSEYSNFSFDKMQSSSFDGIPYPASPNSWTHNSNKVGTQLSGVVNLNEFENVMNKYSSSINEIATPKALNGKLNNNVLMLYNGTKATQSYTSSSKSLSANKYYKITVFVNTHMWDSNSNGVTVLAKNGNNVLGMADNIKTEGSWKRVEFYINSPSSVDVTLELALGYGLNHSSGYAFFDNILVEEKDEANSFSNLFDEYPVATKIVDGEEVKNGEVKLDLTNPMFASTEGRDYNTPVLFVGENKGIANINAGIVDLTGDLKIVAGRDREALRDLTGATNALAITTPLEQDSYYKYTSLLKYTFESGKYYKFSFALFTADIAQEEKEKMYDNDRLAQGVNVELTSLENAKFSYVQSNGKWTNYEFYIGVDSQAISNLVFSLGSDFTGCYGKAFIGNISVEEVEQGIFDQVKDEDTVLKINTVAKADEDEAETSKDKSGNNFSWVYIPTIATFLAIVVAVVGVFVRRNIKFKKRVKVGRAEYDRDTTVLQNKYRRLASAERDKEVREMTKECEELINLRTAYEEKYKDALSRLRSARLANRDGSKRHEIVAIEHEVKNISKDVARFGVQVNNYENEIEFMQTEAYLLDLEKRMMREENSSRNAQRRQLEMTEEEREQAIAKREAKQQRAEQKAQAKAEKVEAKQQKLKAERERVQQELEQAKALDEKYVKEQELKQIRIQEQKLVKEKMKADRELEKLERQKRLEEKVKAEAEQEALNNTETETDSQANSVVENVESTNEQVDETELKVEQSEQVENNVEQAVSVEQTDKEETKSVEPTENAQPLEQTNVAEPTENIQTSNEESQVQTTDEDNQ